MHTSGSSATGDIAKCIGNVRSASSVNRKPGNYIGQDRQHMKSCEGKNFAACRKGYS